MSQTRSDQTLININKKSMGLPLRTRLVLFVLLVSLVPLAIIATRDTLQTQQALTNAEEISLKSGAAQTASGIDTFIQTTLGSISAEAQFIDFATYLTVSPSQPIIQARALDLLNKLRNKSNQYIISYALVDVNGKVLLDTVNFNIQNDESTDAYFPLVQSSDKPVVSPVTYSADKTPSITFASKITNINGNYIGILRVKYNSAVFQDIIKNSVGSSANTSVLLLDPLHIRMADTQYPDLILKSVVPLEPNVYKAAVDSHRLLNLPREEQSTNYHEFEVALNNATKQPFFRADITPSIAGNDTIAVAFLQSIPWEVAYSRPTSIFLANIQKQISINVVLVLSALIIISIITALIARSLTNPISTLAKVADSISHGDFSAHVPVSTTDEIGLLGEAFNRMTEELNQSFNILEVRVAERTADLETARQQSEIRARKLQSIGEISKVISSEQRLELLLPLIARLVSESFGFYHAGIFLHDETNQFTVLQAASSEGGKNMLAQSYRREVGGSGIVGYVAKFGIARIALDVGLDPVFFNNPELPNTRSEMALPLILRDQIVGVIDMQSEDAGAFTENDANTLSILADQIAIAIENARLFTQLQQTLSETQALSRDNLREEWLEFGREGTSIGYHQSLRGGTQLMTPVETDEIRQAMNHGKVLVSNKDENTQQSFIVIPIKLRGQVIGALNIKAPTQERRWSKDEVNLAEAISERLALALENARLIHESERQVLKEQKISDITSKIGTSVRTENILKTAAQELNQLLNGAEILIKLRTNENGNGSHETS